jgi:hypothetical protein
VHVAAVNLGQAKSYENAGYDGGEDVEHGVLSVVAGADVAGLCFQHGLLLDAVALGYV